MVDRGVFGAAMLYLPSGSPDKAYLHYVITPTPRPEESRAAALQAARRLLIEKGPQAVTLKAVASEIGKTHANLLHHFGSAAGLQSALAGLISDRVCAGIAEAVLRARAHEPTRSRSSTAPSTPSARRAAARSPPG